MAVDLWLQGVADHVLPLAHTSFPNWALRSATPLAAPPHAPAAARGRAAAKGRAAANGRTRAAAAAAAAAAALAAAPEPPLPPQANRPFAVCEGWGAGIGGGAGAGAGQPAPSGLDKPLLGGCVAVHWLLLSSFAARALDPASRSAAALRVARRPPRSPRRRHRPACRS